MGGSAIRSLVPEPLADQTQRQDHHLDYGVVLSQVVPSGELVDISVQMLDTHAMVGSHVAAFEHRPEALDAVGVNLTSDVLEVPVIDPIVRAMNTEVAGVSVRVDDGALGGAIFHEFRQRSSGQVGYHLCAHPVGGPILDPDDRCFAGAAPSLGFAGLAWFAADVDFIDFDGSFEDFGGFFVPPFAQALSHEPSRRLRDFEVSMQLHA